jgi:2-polyprenyl-6-methoxyphenol hydroxylase-like FAD-dependent oxidoreductase
MEAIVTTETYYDIITVGGGLAGSSLAKAMAERGAKVLVVERETQFHDRVRGEGMCPWGVTEARALGIYDPLVSTCAHEARYWSMRLGPRCMERDLVETSPHRSGVLNFSHQAMQEELLQLAADSGAEVIRGSTVVGVNPGVTPTVSAQQEGVLAVYRARLVVGADGRDSRVRRSAGFRVACDPAWRLVSGVLMDDLPAREDAIQVFGPPSFGQVALLYPQGGGTVRAYFASGRRSEHKRLSGAADIPTFVQYSIDCGMPAEWLATAKVVGPLATFEGADTWVEHPYRDGVVLVGDAAAANDPSFGSGLSLAVRDVRVLRDQLLGAEDWDTAGHQYASQHDVYYGALHTIESWLGQFLYAVGPQADRMREHAMAALATGGGPDIVGLGPDGPSDEAARVRFLGC